MCHGLNPRLRDFTLRDQGEHELSFTQPSLYARCSYPCQFRIYDDPTEVEPGQTLRLCVSAPSATQEFPMHVVVRFRTAVQVLQIPHASDDGGASRGGLNQQSGIVNRICEQNRPMPRHVSSEREPHPLPRSLHAKDVQEAQVDSGGSRVHDVKC